MKLLLLILLIVISSFGQTVKDVSSIVGIRENQLIGYGMVVGLPGTGDKSKFTMQSLQNLLRNSYIKIPTSSIKSKNIAAVMVTATLPPFSRQGDKIKVNVSSIGDAKSIDAGELLLTQLKGVDGKVYAIAQGNIIANPQNKTVGYIYDGATIENELNYSLKDEKSITLSLIQNNAALASQIESKINTIFAKPIAQAVDTRTIVVQKPPNLSIIQFIAKVQNISLDTKIRKKIIIDIAREIIVAGSDIKIKPVTISQKDFTIKIKKFTGNQKTFDDDTLTPGVNIGDNVKIGTRPVNINLNNALVNSYKEPTVSDLMRSMKIMKIDIQKIIKTLKMLQELNAIDAKIEIIR